MAYLSGPLSITIQHAGIGDADTVYSRSGVPSIWGDSLVHEDIEGVDDNPVFVGEYTHTGEAQGPVDAPGGFKIGAGMVLGLIGVAAIAAAVLMPDKKRSNPRKKKKRGSSKRAREVMRHVRAQWRTDVMSDSRDKNWGP